MQQPARILLSGASGFIGSALVPYLQNAGCETWQLVRHQNPAADEISWQPGTELDPRSLPEGLTAVINLSGSSIAVPFTDANRKLILHSRLDSTSTLVEAILRLDKAPEVFLNASGVGFYGNRDADLLTEQSSAGNDFVADICVQWENALDPLADSSIRSLALRTGLVLDPGGGALGKMLPAFRAGAGAILGSGKQFMSWISLRDYLRCIKFLLEQSDLAGPVNLVSPQPVTNAEFSRSLARALGKPMFLSAPAWALKVAMGEMAELLLLASQRVQPNALESAGFSWQDPELDSTLQAFFQK